MTHATESDDNDRRTVVGVVGDGGLPPDSDRGRRAERLGARLVEAGYRVACGGLGGVMRNVCRGARGADGYEGARTIGILPGGRADDANAYVDIPVPTGLGHARNALVARAEAVVALGGGAGTLSELAMAWVTGRMVLAYSASATGGWSGRVAGEPLDGKDRVPGFDGDRVFAVEHADEVVELLERHLSKYAK